MQSAVSRGRIAVIVTSKMLQRNDLIEMTRKFLVQKFLEGTRKYSEYFPETNALYFDNVSKMSKKFCLEILLSNVQVAN